MIKEENIRDGAPFNMALFTLEKVHNILKSITNISIEGMSDKGQTQHIKYSLINQLFIQSIPLFDAKRTEVWKKKMLERIRKIELKWKSVIKDYKIIGKSPLYDPEIDLELDNITIEIQERLQMEKYFMPPKQDASIGWKQ